MAEIDNIKRNFKDFLEDYKKNLKELLARPDQRLSIHIANMVSEFHNYFSNFPYFKKWYDFFLYSSTLFAILTHDLGKINPYFQFKLRLNESDKKYLYHVKNEIISRSYHSLISALFAIALIDSFNENFIKKNKININNVFDNCKNFSINDFIALQKFVIVLSILNHHSVIFNERKSILSYEFQQDAFNEIIKIILEIWCKPNNLLRIKFIENLTNEITKGLESLKAKKDNKGLFYRNYFLLTNENLIEILNKTFDNIAEILKLEEDSFFTPTYAEKVIDLIDDVLTPFLSNGNDENLEKNVEIYLLTGFISSLLYDLDIWDARFYIPEVGKHKFSFFDKLEPIDTDLILKYVSKPFGVVISNKEDIEFEKPIRPIDFLRNFLFLSIEKEQLKPSKIYIINSPTGAGKTLTLLHSSFKIFKYFLEKYNYIPKIIYGLPFISIGIQVANQISNIMQNKFGKIGTNIICEDNYLSEDIWEEYKSLNSNENTEDYIVKGYDARWLITTWRSQFIVTTFVKIFNSLLKPFKKNILKIHRMAYSIIILDEIQGLPIKYWKLANIILKGFQKIFGATIFLSTATLPNGIAPKNSIILAKSHLDAKFNYPTPKKINSLINRYYILYYPHQISLSQFIERMKEYLKQNPNKDILIVLNTRETVIKCYQSIKNSIDENTEIIILSTLVLPKDRKDSINRIKEFLKSKLNNRHLNKRILVLSTQLIEAGVDLSFQIVIRDLAPIDSIVQIAGRCNRNMEYEQKGLIHVIYLKRDKAKIPDMKLIYTTNNLYTIIDNFFNSATSQKISNNIDLLEQALFEAPIISDEYHLRKKLDSYYSDIIKSNLTTMLISEVSNLKFYDLAKQFELIEKNTYNFYLLPLINNEAKKIHENIKKSNKIPRNFYLHVIPISHKHKKFLEKKGFLKKQIDGSNSILYYYIEEKDFNKIYNPTSGLIIEAEK
ncbi:MAG: CRISPR-associated helicase Cas3' [Promethearchaeota archaeon]